MSLLRAIFGFGLPGLAAGWVLAGSILQFSGDPVGTGAVFAAFASGGALAGRWLIRNPALLGPGLLLLIAAAGLPLLRNWLLPLTSFAFGVLAVRPIRRGDRHAFQTGVLLAVAAAFIAGENILQNPIVLKSVVFTLLPAAVMLTAQTLPAHRRTAILLTAAAGIVLTLLPALGDHSRKNVFSSGTIIRYVPGNGTLLLQTAAGEYAFPRDLSRRAPDLLTAALQPQAEQLRVLVAEDVPGTAAKRLNLFPWIRQTDILQFSALSGDTGWTNRFYHVQDVQKHLRQNPHLKYDLVLFLELPGGSPGARKRLLETAAGEFLNPGGVLVFPGKDSLPLAGRQSGILPGSRQYFRMFSNGSEPLAVTFDELDTRLQMRFAGQTGFLPKGILQSLYELRGPEPVTGKLRPPPGYRFFNTVREMAQSCRIATCFLLGILLFAVFWLSRYPVYGDNFAIFARGSGIMLALTSLLIAASDFQLLLPVPLAAAFGLIALAIPHRQKHIRSLITLAILLLAGAGAGLCLLPSGQAWLTPAILFLLMPVCWLGTGNCGTDSARYLHFFGLLFGLILFALLPPAAALPAAILLLWF